MNKQDCCCPVCEAFEDGFNIGFDEGYKRSLMDDVSVKMQLIKDIENDEDVCTCGECNCD